MSDVRGAIIIIARLVFGGCTFLPFSLGPTGDCSCRH